ncbi:hypothetical protein [Aurantimonas sp. 22II-16-19i]|uniref:hypothetical protein n=1 Tax=Aurantimonas sp. 22II-16-19i TaxID=1317114 RepID=UPI0009F7BB0F|nr:hypothetical protein [Aurantimonas sp. 22II-16-19i]ORE94025.1 hypothetical protein ATO4_14764 [Aurantimonas sp. 22II-16-19i]
MRKFILASALALAATFGAGASAEAASVKIVIGDHQAPRHHAAPRRHHDDRRPVVVERIRPHQRDCVVKKTVKYRHGERIVRKVRVCR